MGRLYGDMGKGSDAMAWDEWERLKSQAAQDGSTRMQLNQLDPGDGGRPAPDPGQYGDLKVTQKDLAKIGQNAFDLYDDLWTKGRRAVPTSDSAAAFISGSQTDSSLAHPRAWLSSGITSAAAANTIAPDIAPFASHLRTRYFRSAASDVRW